MKNLSNKIFMNAQVMIEGNIIRCDNSTIQISNISQIWAGRLPKEHMPLNSVLILCLIAFFGFRILNSIFLAVAVSAVALILVYKYLAQIDYSGLNIQLCSGEIFSFVSSNANFLQEVFNIVNGIIADRHYKANCTISFKGDGTISSSQESSGQESASQETVEERAAAEQAEAKSSKDIQNPFSETMEVNQGNDTLHLELQMLYSRYKEKNEQELEILTLIGQTAHMVKENNREGIRDSFGRFITLGLINECNEMGLNHLIGEVKNNLF